MKIVEKTFGNSVDPIWVVDSWAEQGIVHGFGSRSYNVASGPACWETSFPGTVLALLSQHHAKTIIHLRPPLTPDQVRAMSEHPPAGDAYVADYREPELGSVAVGVKSADCFPVLIRSKSAPVVSVVHCGWRGAESGLLLDTLVYLGRLGLSSRSLEVAIGPGAQSCCYEIGPDVRQLLNRAFAMVEPFSMNPVGPATVTREGKIFGNIRDVLRAQALFFGVPETQIAFTEVCTISDPRLFSYRREKEQAGRQVSFFCPPGSRFPE